MIRFKELAGLRHVLHPGIIFPIDKHVWWRWSPSMKLSSTTVFFLHLTRKSFKSSSVFLSLQLAIFHNPFAWLTANTLLMHPFYSGAQRHSSVPNSLPAVEDGDRFELHFGSSLPSESNPQPGPVESPRNELLLPPSFPSDLWAHGWIGGLAPSS